MSQLAAARAERDVVRQRELRRCQRDLHYLLTEYLGYGWNPKAIPSAGLGKFKTPFTGLGINDRLHKYVCRWLDARADYPQVAYFIERGGHKTTMDVGMMIQEILRNPNVTMIYFQAVDELAGQVVQEVGNHLLENPKLRSLDPILRYADDWFIHDLRGKYARAFPAPNAKRFLGADQFRLGKGGGKRATLVRFPTLLGKGALSERTGAHSLKTWIDDPIGLKTVRENRVGEVSQWFQSTVVPVTDGKWFRVSGTFWVDWGFYDDICKDPEWHTLVIPGSVKENLDEVDWSQNKIHLTPDETLENPTFGPASYHEVAKKRLRWLKKQMKSDFPPQVMLDPSPAEEKPWDKDECERYIEASKVRTSHGSVFILVDPAPWLVGDGKGLTEKVRGDGSKDEWAFAVVLIRVNGERQEKVLLDGSSSRHWGEVAGWDECVRLMSRWKTNRVFVESYGGPAELERMTNGLRDAARRCGGRNPYTDEKGLLPQFHLKYDFGAKNVRFSALADQAKGGEFLICETVPDSFLNDPKDPDLGFLLQARQWRPMGKANGLRYDDRADVVSRCTDEALQRFAPKPWHFSIDDPEHPLARTDGDDDYKRRSRYCAA